MALQPPAVLFSMYAFAVLLRAPSVGGLHDEQ
jgi:hypothetical protein